MPLLAGALTRLWQVWSAQGAAGYAEAHWRERPIAGACDTAFFKGNRTEGDIQGYTTGTFKQ